MPVVTIKAKASDKRTPEKIDALIQEVRRTTAAHLEVPVERVLVVYEELAAGIYFDGGPSRPEAKPAAGRAGQRGVKV